MLQLLIVLSAVMGPIAPVHAATTSQFNIAALTNLIQVLVKALDTLNALNELSKPNNESPAIATSSPPTTSSTTTTSRTTKVPLGFLFNPNNSAYGNESLNKAEVNAVLALLGQLGLGSLLGLHNVTTPRPVTDVSTTVETDSTANVDTVVGFTDAPRVSRWGHEDVLATLGKTNTAPAPTCEIGAVCNMYQRCIWPCTCSNVMNRRMSGRCGKTAKQPPRPWVYVGFIPLNIRGHGSTPAPPQLQEI